MTHYRFPSKPRVGPGTGKGNKGMVVCVSRFSGASRLDVSDPNSF